VIELVSNRQFPDAYIRVTADAHISMRKIYSPRADINQTYAIAVRLMRIYYTLMYVDAYISIFVVQCTWINYSRIGYCRVSIYCTCVIGQ